MDNDQLCADCKNGENVSYKSWSKYNEVITSDGIISVGLVSPQITHRVSLVMNGICSRWSRTNLFVHSATVKRLLDYQL